MNFIKKKNNNDNADIVFACSSKALDDAVYMCLLDAQSVLFTADALLYPFFFYDIRMATTALGNAEMTLINCLWLVGYAGR